MRVFTWAAADFLMVAQTRKIEQQIPDLATLQLDEQGQLVGRIFLLQRHGGKARKRMTRLRGRMRRLIGKVNRVAKMPDVVSKIVASIEGGREGPIGEALIIPEAEFVLYRSGEFRIRLIKSTLPVRFCDENGNSVDDKYSSIYSSRFEEAVVPHFYYFVRDMAHRHYHHDKRSDSLLPVELVKPDDDVTWRRQTTYHLARAAIEARRDDDLLQYKRSAGIAAYATAFQTSLGRVFRDPTDYNRLVVNDQQLTYDWEHMVTSMEAQTGARTWLHGVRTQTVAAVLSVFLAWLALWLAIAQNKGAVDLQTGLKPPDAASLVWMFQTVFEQPLPSGLVAFGVTALIFELVNGGIRSLRGPHRLWLLGKRFGYAIASSISYRLNRIWPAIADGVGAYIGGLILALSASLAGDLGWAITTNQWDQGLILPWISRAVHWLLAALKF